MWEGAENGQFLRRMREGATGGGRDTAGKGKSDRFLSNWGGTDYSIRQGMSPEKGSTKCLWREQKVGGFDYRVGDTQGSSYLIVSSFSLN